MSDHPPPIEKRLDRMIELAFKHAQQVLLKGKQRALVPTWVLFDADGKFQIHATPWEDEADKKLAELFIRIQMIQHKTVAYSLVTEAWVAAAPKGWTPDQPRTFPEARLDPERREAVIALACTRTEHRAKSWWIRRNHLEQIAALEPNWLDGDYQSWLTTLLQESKK